MKKIIIVFLLIFAFSGMLFADSIWKEGASSSPYSTQKAYKIGDIVYVLILESASALQKGTTKTDVQDNLSGNLTHTIDRLSSIIPLNTQVAGKAQLKYQGVGRTERSSTVQAKVAARVVDVLPNSNLRIVGQHVVEVNNEEQSIIIAGVIRSKDISMDNTIYSYQVANATVSVKGSGVVGQAISPGWFTRIFNWIF